MYAYTLLLAQLAAAACAADSPELLQPPSGPDPSAATLLSEALEADDACLTKTCGTALLQTRGVPEHGASGAQVEAGAQRRPAKAAPKPGDEKYVFLQETLPGSWGDVLDAGTGPSSLAFLAACNVSTITAVTANESSVRSSLDSSGDFLDLHYDKVIAGNWRDSEFLRGRQFDVVLADWLLGSVEFFAPHFQVGLVRRLHSLVKPGGWLLFTGREPDNPKANSTVGARLLLDIDALRDGATILGQRHPYREIPQWWVEQEMNFLGFGIHARHQVPLTLDEEYVFGQLEWAGDEVKHVRDEHLRAALEERKLALHRTAQRTKSEWHKQSSGNEYVVVAKRI